MTISDFAIRRPVITVVTMLALVVFGIVALTQLDTDEFPDVQQPVVAVAVPYPGASPDTVEREVINPIEEAISGISGVDQVMSNSLDSFGNIIVIFVFQKDVQQATQEIRDAISGIRNRLPPEMEEPVLTQFDPADQPILSLTLSSPSLTGAELTRLADPDITRVLSADEVERVIEYRQQMRVPPGKHSFTDAIEVGGAVVEPHAFQNGLGLVDHELAVLDPVAHGHEAAHPHALLAGSRELVADAFPDHLALELGEGEQDIQGQSSHARGRVEGLGDRDEGDVVGVEKLHQFGEVGKRHAAKFLSILHQGVKDSR